jgi:hypothetical protein
VLTWDEKDGGNTTVCPGTYVVRLVCGSTTLQTRFVIMR